MTLLRKWQALQAQRQEHHAARCGILALLDAQIGQLRQGPASTRSVIAHRVPPAPPPGVPEDDFSRFIARSCRLDEDGTATASELWEAYLPWRRRGRREERLSRPAFAGRLRALGCQDIRGSKGQRLWEGIELLPERPAPSPPPPMLSHGGARVAVATDRPVGAPVLTLLPPSPGRARSPHPPAAMTLGVPAVDPDFEPTPETLKFLQYMLELAKERPVNLLFFGPPGTGKTETARLFAALAERTYLKFDCGTARDRMAWFGAPQLDGARTTFVRTPLARALKTPGAVICLDEINRVHPDVQGALTGLLDDTREVIIPEAVTEPDLQPLHVAPGTIIIGTANLGHEYVGTHPLDPAIDDRLVYRWEFPIPPPDIMTHLLTRRTGCSTSTAEQLVKVLLKVNEQALASHAEPLSRPLGLRSILAAARMIARRAGIGMACRTAIIMHYPSERDGVRERHRVQEIVKGIFGPEGLA